MCQNTYEYSYYNRSTVNTELVVEYTLANGTKTYTWLGVVDPSLLDWTKVTKTLTTPVDAVKVTIQTVIKSSGTVQIDEHNLVLL